MIAPFPAGAGETEALRARLRASAGLAAGDRWVTLGSLGGRYAASASAARVGLAGTISPALWRCSYSAGDR